MRWARFRIARQATESLLVGVEDWLPLSLQNSWVAVSGYVTPAVYRDPLGVVWLRGRVQGGSGPVAVLPLRHRPEGLERFASCEVGVDGTITSLASVVELSGIAFRPKG